MKNSVNRPGRNDMAEKTLRLIMKFPTLQKWFLFSVVFFNIKISFNKNECICIQLNHAYIGQGKFGCTVLLSGLFVLVIFSSCT